MEIVLTILVVVPTKKPIACVIVTKGYDNKNLVIGHTFPYDLVLGILEQTWVIPYKKQANIRKHTSLVDSLRMSRVSKYLQCRHTMAPMSPR